MLFPTLGPSSLPVVVAQPDEKVLYNKSKLPAKKSKIEKLKNGQYYTGADSSKI